MGMKWEAISADDFLALVSSLKFLGNERIKTQHFIGATKWVQIGGEEIHGYHQMRVAHHKYVDTDFKEVEYAGHAHGKATTRYRVIDGVWKFAGLEPEVRWGEHDLDKIFEH
jgi:scytalone dehydratase